MNPKGFIVSRFRFNTVTCMKKIAITLLILVLGVTIGIIRLTTKEVEPSKLMLLKAKYSEKAKPSVDHSKFPVLQTKFTSPEQVTAACNSCHNGRAAEVMKSNHWNWERAEYVKGRGIVYLGKKNALNNFCIAAEGNEQSCAKCHIGLGKTDAHGLDYQDSTNIDCLVCHDNSSTYTKAPEKTGAPLATLDLNTIAQNVGKPTRSNCGVCHFFGGGGNNVKHGDLEKAMFEPNRDVDVHMAQEGSNLQCTQCHVTNKHMISGKMYSLSSMNRNRAECEYCHTENPHDDQVLNKHTLKVACQTCHIPEYAKVNATKTEWDWSTAGKLRDGKPFEVDDSAGNHVYLSIKGSFKWATKAKPDYIWFDGTASHYLLGDKIQDTSKPVELNKLNGSYADGNSKIIPVKIHRARQPYDPVNKILIKPKLYADKAGEGAFWKDFDWKRASEVGMKEANLPFSGNVTFIRTDMYWPVNHMVSTKEKSVQCVECHTRDNGRLAALTDFYMPGRDFNPLVESAGKFIILLSFLVIIIHGGVRIYSARNLKRRN